MLVPLAIKGVGAVAGAIKKSHAAKAASKEQTAAAQQASDYYTRAMGQLAQLYGPYINTGAGAMNTIGRMITPGPGARFASPGPPNSMPQVTPPSYPPSARPQPPGAPNAGQAMPRGGTPFSSMAGPPMGGRSMAGPYYMADGGDMIVDRPTMFIAGEAGPERATFGRPRQGGGQQLPMLPRQMPPNRPPPTFNPQRPMANLYAPPPQQGGGIPNPLSGRAGALGGGMRGGPAAAGANQLRQPMAGPMAGLLG